MPKREMSVVFLSPHSDPEADLGEPDAGGQCVYEHMLAKALVGIEGVRVRTYCRDTGKRPRISDYGRYTVERIQAGPRKFVPKEQIEIHLNDFAKMVVGKLDPDDAVILHGHYWDGGKAGLLVKSMIEKKIPLIWTPHSLGSIKRSKFEGENNELIYQFIPRIVWENYTIYASNQIIVSSPQEKNNLLRNYSLLKNKVRVIAPGTDLDQFGSMDKKKAREYFGLPTDGKMLLGMGRMSRSKGFHRAILALKQLREMGEKKVFLVICGGAAEPTDRLEKAYLMELKALAGRMQLEEQVLFHPAISHAETNTMYNAADVLLMTSQHEPFGLTVLEAMAAGTPVVSHDVGGPTDIIADDQTGYLVDFDNHQSAAGVIDQLLSNEALATTITMNAQSFVKREFSWRTKARLFHRVYQIALEQEDDPFKLLYENSYFMIKNLLH